MRTFEPMQVTEPKAGVRVYDLGQNFSGLAEHSHARRGGRDGQARSPASCSTTPAASRRRTPARRSRSPTPRAATARGNVASALQLHRLPLRAGRGRRRARSRSSKGSSFTPALPVVGQFSCSNELLNRIHDLILAAIRSNMQSVLTDCPHREKLGWLEQAHLMAPSIMANFDALALLREDLPRHARGAARQRLRADDRAAVHDLQAAVGRLQRFAGVGQRDRARAVALLPALRRSRRSSRTTTTR